VVVQPSHKEGWGLTVLEANACGTPVVATDVPGLRDSVRPDLNGLRVPRADPEALADAVVRVLEDPDLRGRLSAGALDWASRFGWDAVADAFAGVLKALAAGESMPEVRDFLADDSGERAA